MPEDRKQEEKKDKKSKKKKFQGGPAYPAYDRALTTQFRRNPQAAGVQRALGTGGLGAVLGALAARLISKKPAAVAGGAALGGLVGGIPGYVSGRDEALSDYSRLLFLRRRLGINDPGELEALLRHPEIAASGVKEGMDKQANKAALARILLGTGLGGATGAAHGYYVSPKVLEYEHIPAARKSSTLIDALTGAALGGFMGATGRKAFKGLKPKHIFTGAGIYAGGQAAPVIQATLAEQRDALKEQANAAKVTSIPYNMQRMLNTGTARGAGVGVAGAGIAAILSGLMRRRSEDEILKHRSRGAMVGTDFLKYLLPAMLAGGVVGSLRNTNNATQ